MYIRIVTEIAQGIAGMNIEDILIDDQKVINGKRFKKLGKDLTKADLDSVKVGDLILSGEFRRWKNQIYVMVYKVNEIERADRFGHENLILSVDKYTTKDLNKKIDSSKRWLNQLY